MVVVHLVSQVRFLLCHDVRRSTSIGSENLMYSFSIVSLLEASNSSPSELKISCIRLLLQSCFHYVFSARRFKRFFRNVFSARIFNTYFQHVLSNNVFKTCPQDVLLSGERNNKSWLYSELYN